MTIFGWNFDKVAHSLTFKTLFALAAAVLPALAVAAGSRDLCPASARRVVGEQHPARDPVHRLPMAVDAERERRPRQRYRLRGWPGLRQLAPEAGRADRRGAGAGSHAVGDRAGPLSS